MVDELLQEFKRVIEREYDKDRNNYLSSVLTTSIYLRVRTVYSDDSIRAFIEKIVNRHDVYSYMAKSILRDIVSRYEVYELHTLFSLRTHLDVTIPRELNYYKEWVESKLHIPIDTPEKEDALYKIVFDALEMGRKVAIESRGGHYDIKRVKYPNSDKDISEVM